jgi:hypothetical protein
LTAAAMLTLLYFTGYYPVFLWYSVD